MNSKEKEAAAASDKKIDESDIIVEIKKIREVRRKYDQRATEDGTRIEKNALMKMRPCITRVAKD